MNRSKFFITIKILFLLLATYFLVGTVITYGECSQNKFSPPPSEILSGPDNFFNLSDNVFYSVKEGDTLYAIAAAHGVSVREIMSLNNLNSSLIRPGDMLLLPTKNNYEKRLSRGDISREELLLLARLIHAEARGESLEGQVAVGAVILNRLASPYFPKTIPEIIFQKTNKVYQFTPVADGSINLEPDDKAIQAALLALAGNDPTGGALFFYNPDISKDTWIKTLPVLKRIGNHVFATTLRS